MDYYLGEQFYINHVLTYFESIYSPRRNCMLRKSAQNLLLATIFINIFTVKNPKRCVLYGSSAFAFIAELAVLDRSFLLNE